MRREQILLGAVVAGFVIDAVAAEGTQAVGDLLVDRTEVTIEQFSVYVQATNTVTKAEEAGGGLVYEGGWQQKPGWNWRKPFGTEADSALPAVHINFDEAQAFCVWAGKRLPTDSEWHAAAYSEQRSNPSVPFTRGQSYPYPTGESPNGANCLDECGQTPAIDFSDRLSRGTGPAPVASTKAGVNGLYDMGANVWEWTQLSDSDQQGTRGGSWWYGTQQMSRDHRASKPRDMAAVYIGFRCVKDKL